jgi:hypothetical protein
LCFTPYPATAMLEFLLSISVVANVILFACLVQTMAEKNAKEDAIPKYAESLEIGAQQYGRLVIAYNRMKQTADWWMKEAMRLKGVRLPPGADVTDQPKPSPEPWTHPGRN